MVGALQEIVTGERPRRGWLRPPLVPKECPQQVGSLVLGWLACGWRAGWVFLAWLTLRGIAGCRGAHILVGAMGRESGCHCAKGSCQRVPKKKPNKNSPTDRVSTVARSCGAASCAALAKLKLKCCALAGSQVADLIARCIDVDPERRPSAQELAVELGQLVMGRQGSGASTTAGRAPPESNG